ncbi:MAG: hypothetical protein LBI77_02370 [Puniceicoccales bacterium]|nr:hypothetical protein [Puniceicoccales bacterium]
MKSVRISNITYILKKYNQKEAKAGNIIFEKFIDKILEISSEFRGKNSGNLSDFLQKIEQKLGFLKCLAVPVVFRNRNYTACREIPKSTSLALAKTKFFEKKYTPKRRINLIGNVLRALDFLHNDCKIWHNDLQPRNFLLTKTGDLFIIDFDRAEMSKNPSKEDDFCAMLSFPIYFALCDDLNLNWKEVRFIPLFQHDIFSGIENAEDVFLGVENEGDLFSGGMEKIKEMCKQEDKSVKKQIEWINARFSDTHRQLLSIREKRENEANEHSFKCHKKRASEMQNKCRILLKKNDISSLAKHGVNVDDIKTALEQLEEAEKIKIEDPSGMSKVYEMVNSINGNVMNLLNIM